MQIRLIFLLFISPLFCLSQNSREREMRNGDSVFVMKKYCLCFLMRGEQAKEIPESELPALQKAHLAHLTEMAESGKLDIAGPFEADMDLRGILIFDTEKSEADSLAGADPAVKAGRLKVECHEWWSQKGVSLK